jgi:uncharacterized protein YaiE (UPF0345 family)
MERRAFISAVLGASVAGCLGGSGDSGTSSPPSEFSFTLESSTDTLEDTGSVADGEYEVYSLAVPLATAASCEANVTSGPAVDLLTMDQNEFNRYRDGDRFSVLLDWSETDTESVTVEGQLPAGDYRFVVDRTAATVRR